MSIALYMDEHVPGAITRAIRRRGADILTAQEDGFAHTPDPQILDRATALSRVVVTNDQDFLVEAARRQRSAEHFAGVVFCSFDELSTRQILYDLEIICVAGQPDDFANRVEYLPL